MCHLHSYMLLLLKMWCSQLAFWKWTWFLREGLFLILKNMMFIHWFWKWTYWVCVDGVNSCILKTWWSHIDFENEHAVFVVMILIVFWKIVRFPHLFWKWTYRFVDDVTSCILKSWCSHIDFEDDHIVCFDDVTSCILKIWC